MQATAESVSGQVLPNNCIRYDESEDLDCYLERFELYLIASGLTVPDTQSRVVALLLNAIEARYYGIVRDLVSPAKPSDKSYVQLKQILRKHFKRTPVTVAEKRKFIRRDQAPGESTSDYVVQLKHLSLHCEYADKLDEQLRDRFISGLNDESTSLKLMEKATETPNMTFQQAVDFTLSKQTAAGEVRAMRSEGSSGCTKSSVHAVRGKQQSGQKGSRRKQECYRCGRHHTPEECWFKSETCRYCKKKGHIERKCRAKGKNEMKQTEHSDCKSKMSHKSKVQTKKNNCSDVHKMHENRKPMSNSNARKEARVLHDSSSSSEECSVEYDHTLFKLDVISKSKVRPSTGSESDPIIVPVVIEGKVTHMELDTGSSVSMIPLSYYEKHLSHVKMHESEKSLVSFITNQTVKPVGKVHVEVTHGKYQGKLSLYVVEHTEYLLFGRDWLSIVPLNWKSLISRVSGNHDHSQVHHVGELDRVLNKHNRLFEDRLGKLTKARAHISVKDDAKPVTTRPYKVPFAMRDKVEEELERLQKCGVLTAIDHSEWSTGIVAVPKKDGSVRICGNYKTTVNPVLDPVQPPNINVENILANLGGGVLFSTVDLAHAYNQLELDEESKKFLVISTHTGLFQQNRLVFGITSAPAIWQSAIEQVLQGIPGVQVYLDDILVTGRTVEEHHANLDKDLTCLEERNLTLRKMKCTFAQPSVEFLGHVIDANGVHTVEEKVQKIRESS
nr:uncharacterized protein K02A2.6-like [Lytechinus pictus]